MKENYINLVFVIDESGSMTGTENDVVGGFKKVVDEQKEIKEGTCTVSYFKFASNVEEVFIGKDVNQVEYLDGKCTLDEAVYNIKLNSRHFAKRQMTWFRNKDEFIICV